MKRQLVELAHARSGDKGDIANIALFAPDRTTYDLLVREVTTERVRTHVEGIDGGASRSLRSDALGKSLSSALLRMEIEA